VDSTVIITGNVASDPRSNVTQRGDTWTRFRLASTPRWFDKAANEWRDGESLFITVRCFRQLAKSVAYTMSKGDPVMVVGRLVQRTWEQDGAQRKEIEVDATSIGPDLTRATAELQRRRPAPSPVAGSLPAPREGDDALDSSSGSLPVADGDEPDVARAS
jgi:single-strand DNA-binding protein